jgi:hypothetical protein
MRGKKCWTFCWIKLSFEVKETLRLGSDFRHSQTLPKWNVSLVPSQSAWYQSKWRSVKEWKVEVCWTLTRDRSVHSLCIQDPILILFYKLCHGLFLWESALIVCAFLFPVSVPPTCLHIANTVRCLHKPYQQAVCFQYRYWLHINWIP